MNIKEIRTRIHSPKKKSSEDKSWCHLNNLREITDNGTTLEYILLFRLKTEPNMDMIKWSIITLLE
jgi:hypothetical protein